MEALARSESTGGPGRKNLIALKIEISPEIVREGICGNKIFTLVPPHVETVRAFKNHLATNVLKTHVPFYFFNGEYRILDEDDIQILTLVKDHCRIIPVPQPKSALSTSMSYTNSPAISSTSTPLGVIYDTCPTKRVKFSDESSILDPNNSSGYLSGKFVLAKPHGNGNGSADGTCTGHDQVDDATATATTISNGINGNAGIGIQAESPIEDDKTSKRKRKRRRPHKSKRHDRSLSPIDKEDNGDGAFDTIEREAKTSTPFVEKAVDKKRKLKVKSKSLNNYDADESSELDHQHHQQCQSQSQTQVQQHNDVNVNGVKGLNNGHGPHENGNRVTSPKKSKKGAASGTGSIQNGEKSSEFLSPNTAFSEKGYKRLRNSSSMQENTPSFYNGSFISMGSAPPTPLSSDESITVEKRRQDTPMLPRVLKNPCATYQFVKKSLSFNSNGHEHDAEDNDQTQNQVNGGTDENRNENEGKNSSSASAQVHPEGLPKVTCIDDIDVGDVLSYQILELDENYSPVVSGRKIASISAKNGSLLTLNVLDGNEVKQRSGAYEIEDEDMLIETLDPLEHEFSKLLDPRLVSKHGDANTVQN